MDGVEEYADDDLYIEAVAHNTIEVVFLEPLTNLILML